MLDHPAPGELQPSPYGFVARLLHWTIFFAIAIQFMIGYAMDRFDDLLEGPVDRWLGGDEDNLLLVHAFLGICILLLALIRLLNRQTAGLPPWAETLSHFERQLAHRTEMVLYALMFSIPLSGLALVLFSGEDWELWGREWEAPFEVMDDDILLAGHISTHLLFAAVFAAHLGLVLKHQFVNRDRLLRRML